jgi:hypothetical protein
MDNCETREDANKGADKPYDSSPPPQGDGGCAITPEPQPQSSKSDWYRRIRNAPKWIEAFCAVALVGITGTYTYYAGQQLTAMKGQLRQSDEAFRIAERPVMVLGRKDGTVAEFKESKNPDSSGIVLYFQNTGHLPAINVCVTADMGNTYQEPGIRGLVRDRAKNGIGQFYLSGTACPSIPGDSVYPYRMVVPRKLADEAKNGDRTVEHFVDATVQYCDSFGKYSCSKYTIVYHSDFGDFRNVTQEDCGLKYGEYPPLPSLNNPQMEIIPTPCDQPGDEESREKALKQWKKKNNIP